MSSSDSRERRVQAVLAHLRAADAAADAAAAQRSGCPHLSRQVTGANEGELPADVSALPLPPICEAADGIFPKFPEMLDHMKQVGGVFTYKIVSGRRVTIIADPELYEVVFSPGEMGATPGVGDAVKTEADRLAHAWFGIPRGICAYTRPSLDSIRKVIGPRAVRPLVDQVGRGVQHIFEALPDSGEADLVSIAHATFWPVNEAMFGTQTMDRTRDAKAADWFHAFDEYIPPVTRGMPSSMFEDMQAAAGEIVGMFERAIAKGAHRDAKGCPVLHARFAPIDEETLAGFSDKEKAQFMLSMFWAPQANTLPLTFWMLAHIVADPAVRAKVEQEVRAAPFANAPNADGQYPYEEDTLPYTHACMKEALRLYVANMTHRNVSRDIPLRRSDGSWIRIPTRDMLSVASYTRHYDPAVFPDPHKFKPERWVEGPAMEKHGPRDFWPFALGRWSCSGKFLAMGEMPLLAALFFREFDVQGPVPVPEADWDEVVASVRPKGWPHEVGSKVYFKRVKR